MKPPGKSAQENPDIFSGELLEEDLVVTVEQLCHSCRLQTDHVIAYVQEGVLDARGEDLNHWTFSISSIRRVRTARRLQRDLGVNLAGAALALELLDRISELEQQLP